MSVVNPVYPVNPVLFFFGKLHLTKSLSLKPLRQRSLLEFQTFGEEFENAHEPGGQLLFLGPTGEKPEYMQGDQCILDRQRENAAIQHGKQFHGAHPTICAVSPIGKDALVEKQI